MTCDERNYGSEIYGLDDKGNEISMKFHEIS
jgi:hypothetical protein